MNHDWRGEKKKNETKHIHNKKGANTEGKDEETRNTWRDAFRNILPFFLCVNIFSRDAFGWRSKE